MPLIKRAGTRITIDQAISGGMSSRKGGGSRGPKFISKWRDDVEVERKGKDKIKVAKLDVLLAGEAPFVKYYAHQVPVLVEFKKRDEKDKQSHVWGREWMCFESEDILDGQNFRKEDGRREHPPEVCPICLLNDHLYNAILDGELDPLTTAFVFEHPSAEESVEVTVGGFCGYFNRHFWQSLDEKNEEDSKLLERLKEAGIRESTSWKESGEAKSKFIIQVIDFEDPDSGVQLTREATALGFSLEKAIEHEIEAGGESGHPFRHPYVFRFKYMPEALMSDRYDVVAMRGHEVTEDMVRLVQEGPYPDMTKALEYGNVKTMRAWLERSAQIEIPWDAIFGPIEAHCDESGIVKFEAEPEASDEKGSDGDEPEPPAPKTTRQRKEPEPEEDVSKIVDDAVTANREPDVAMIPCDVCKKPMREDAEECPHCGEKYEITRTDDPPAEAEPPKEEKPAKATAKKDEKAKAGAKAKGDKFKF